MAECRYHAATQVKLDHDHGTYSVHPKLSNVAIVRANLNQVLLKADRTPTRVLA
jgi:hypothetical protein